VIRRFAILAAISWALAGCMARVSAPELAEEEIRARRDALGPEVLNAFRDLKGRLLQIEYRLRTANAPLCGPLVVPELGVLMADENSFSEGVVQGIASSSLGIGDRATVVHALPSAAFIRAGGRIGDALADAEHESLTRFVIERSDRDRPAAPISVEMIRQGQPIELTIEPDVACAVRAGFSQEGTLLPRKHDAFTSAIPAGALRYFDDDELAVLIGHQLAHALVDLAPAPPTDREAASDRIGVFMAARARFDYAVAPKLWERIAAEYPGAIEGWPAHHGMIARRMPALHALVDEIERLAASGQPLHPGRF
jgi:hypothetical protein